MGYISKVKIPSETEAYDIFADKSLKDGDGNVISTTYFKTADAPKIGTADADNQLKKIEYTEESAIPSPPDAGTEYACTDFIGYNDLDSNLQSKIDDAITMDSLKAGDGIAIAANTSGGVEVKVDPAKKYLSIDDISAGLPYKNTDTNEWYAISYTPEATPNRLVQRDDNGDFIAKHISVSTPSSLTHVPRVYEVGEVVKITAAAGVTSGTLTVTQRQAINRYICSFNGAFNNNSWILFNKERYYPMAYEHQTDYNVYANVEYENDDFTMKAITVNLKTGAWLLNTLTPTPKLYMHNVAFSILGGGFFTGVFISADKTAYTNETIVGKRSVSVYNSSGYGEGLITNVYIDGLSGTDLDATVTVNNSLTYALANTETLSVVSDTVTPL